MQCKPSITAQCFVWLIVSRFISSTEYGLFCNHSSDCNDAAPFCNIYFVDTSYMTNLKSDISGFPSAVLSPRMYGVCVGCLSDCDCDVNQYCGTDPHTPIKVPPFVSENVGTGSNLYRKQKILTISASFSNLTMRSICIDYLAPSARCYQDFISELEAEVVSENEEIIYPGQPARQTNTLRMPTGWPKARAADFCGQINSFGPAFYTIKTSGNRVDSLIESDRLYQSSAATSTRTFSYDYYNSPAVCPPWSVFKDDAIKCKSCLHGDNCESADLKQEYCCSNPSSFDPQTRSCSSSSAYRSCRNACRGQLGSMASDVNCSAIQPSSQFLTSAEAVSYCACVSRCEACVALNGGCGSKQKDSLLPSAVWGTCSGTCPSPSEPAVPEAQSEPVVQAQAQSYPCLASGAALRITDLYGTIEFEVGEESACGWLIAPPNVGAVRLSITTVDIDSYRFYLLVMSCRDPACTRADTIKTISLSSNTTWPQTVTSSTPVLLLRYQSTSMYASGGFTAQFSSSPVPRNRITTCSSKAAPSPVQAPRPSPADISTCQPKCLDCLAEAADCACPDVVPTYRYTPPCSRRGEVSVSSYEEGFWARVTSDPVEWSGHCERGACRVCMEGSARCTTSGISQVCRDGVWARYRANKFTVDLDPPLHQAAYAAAVFTAFICCAVSVSAALGCWTLRLLMHGMQGKVGANVLIHALTDDDSTL